MFFEKTAEVYTPGTHGSTFGGNPVSCAGAYNIIKRLDDAFLKSVEEKHDYIISELGNAEGVVGITGLGLMLGIETKKDVNEVLKECQENGVLPIKAKNKLRLLPPLNIPFEDLEKAVGIIKNAIREEL
jgi:acetylornithine/N-succinyldiaminopimelate aminotransferase